MLFHGGTNSHQNSGHTEIQAFKMLTSLAWLRRSVAPLYPGANINLGCHGPAV